MKEKIISFIKTAGKKVLSRKFIAAVVGSASGVALIYSGECNQGTALLITSLVGYMIAEGYVDAKAVVSSAAVVSSVASTANTIAESVNNETVSNVSSDVKTVVDNVSSSVSNASVDTTTNDTATIQETVAAITSAYNTLKTAGVIK